MNLEKNATGRVRWHGLMAMLAVIAVVSMAVVAVGLDESDGSTYGSEPEPYGYVNIIPSEVSDNSTFYIVKGGTLWIGFDLDESDFVESELIGAGLSFDAEKGEATGTITNSCILNVDGKRLNIVAVSPAYGTDVSDYPTYQASYREDYELDMVRHVGDSINERFEITFKNNYDYSISTDQEYEFNQAGISFDVDSESNGWTSTYYLTVTGTVREIMSFDYRVSLIQMDVESHYIHYVYLTGHVEFYYTITFDPGAGTCSVSTMNYSSTKDNLELPGATPAQNGYHFEGWYTDPSGGERVGGTGDNPFNVVPPNGDFILYAHYAEDTNPVVSIDITGSASIGVGESTTLNALATLLHPNEDGNRHVVWDLIDGEGVVSWGAETNLETGGRITVTGLSVGTATFRAMAADGSTDSNGDRISDYFTISVSESSSVERNNFTLIYRPTLNASEVSHMPDTFSVTNSTQSYYETQVAMLVPTHPENDFVGWSYSSSASKVDLEPGDPISLSPGTTYLYAVWKPIETMWTLSFDPNGGTGGPPQISEYETGQSHTFRIPGAQYNPNPPDASKEFGGWSREPNSGIVAAYPGGSLFTDKQDTILYAIWNDVSESNKFTLHFDANRGEGVPDDITNYSQDSTYPADIPNTKPSRPGYEFRGWALTPYWSEGDDYYPAGGSIIIYPGTTTLYAIWSQTNFTITFNANNGTGGPETVVASGTGEAQVMIPTGPDPTRDGYTFMGWSTDPNGPVDPDYAKGRLVTISENITLYAVWSQNSQPGGDDDDPEGIDYEFHFIVGEGVENAPEPLDVTVKGDENGVSFQFPETIPTSEGLTFLGWSNRENSESVVWYAGETYTFTSADRVNYFYPVWETGVDTWSLSFHPNGGIGGPATIYKTSEGDSCEFMIPTEPRPSRSGYTFLGWDRDPSVNRPSIPVADTETPYTVELENTEDKNAVLYAIWAEGNEDTFTLSFDANGGSDVPASLSGQDVGSHKFTIPLQYPNRSGYIFAGWSDSSTGGIVAYVGGTYVASSQDVTLYAVWVADDGTSKNFTVFYQPFEGADPVTKLVASNGNSAVHTLMTEDDEDFVSRVGYKFVGWSETEGGKVIDGGSYSTEAMNVVLYAVWSSTSATFPEATFDYTIDGLTVSFDASMAPNALTWYWDLGDGTKVGLKSFEHTFPGAGTYLVSLTVTNGGQQDVKKAYITVEDSGISIWIYVAIIAIVAIMAVAVLHYKGVI